MYRGQGTAAPPRTHQSLVVQLGGRRYLVEAAFGGTNPLAPLNIATASPQHDRENTYRLTPAAQSGLPSAALADVDYVLEVQDESSYEPLYGFSDRPLPRSDIEVANHYTSTSPGHTFTSAPVAALHTPSGLRLRTPDGESTLGSANELRESAAEIFGIVIGPGTAQRAYEKAVQAAG